MKYKLIYLSLFTVALSAISINVSAVNIVDKPNEKAVGNVKWQLQKDINAESLVNKAIPNDDVSIFFVRPADDDLEQTSAIIAINDRFQVSLQPGSYTQVYSCSGINRISAEVTGVKSNDLLSNSYELALAPNQNHFFYVDVDSAGSSTIQQIENSKALDYLVDKKYQSHQITRVVPNCPQPIPVIQEPKPAPVLDKEVSIELKVLFDNDKAIVKPQFYNEVENLANFMNKYSNTTAVIEGHTDSNASEKYNQKLSERRANAIKYLLIQNYGIDANRLTAIGYGELRPIATNDTVQGRQLNRRTVAVIRERVRVDQQGNQIID